MQIYIVVFSNTFSKGIGLICFILESFRSRHVKWQGDDLLFMKDEGNSGSNKKDQQQHADHYTRHLETQSHDDVMIGNHTSMG